MIKTFPLNKLVQSPRNVRRHSAPAADAELKASIAARGLLQNLIVCPCAKGKFEVEAGERRRKAMLALAEDKVLSKDHEVTCLVLEDTAEAAIETSLAENFHRLAMNPADEAQAFAALIDGGASVEDVARRFGLTVRYVEGRLRLARLAPVVFEALASSEITFDMAKAYVATSDQEIQPRVFEQISSAYYASNSDSIRRMVLSGTVRGSDPRARLVGRDAYLAAGGRIERELFDDEGQRSLGRCRPGPMSRCSKSSLLRRWTNRLGRLLPSRAWPGSSRPSIPTPVTTSSKDWSGSRSTPCR